MVNSRRKGKTFELEIVKHLKEVYPNAKRQLEYQEGFGYDIANTGRLRIQCKNYEAYAPITKIEEAYSACNDENGCIPVLVTKGKNKPTMAVIPFYFFKELVKLYQQQEDKCQLKETNS